MQSALESEMSFLLADTQEIITARRLSRRSEIPASLLNGLRSNFRTFSECALIDNANYLDFDSAIPRFESWHPSQPVRSLRRRFRLCEDRRHFRGLAGNGPVFGEENRALPTTARAYVPGKGRYWSW
jgi:hypothetical protein